MTYKNKFNNQIIREENIASDTKDSLTYFDGNTWKTVPKNTVEEYNEVDSDTKIKTVDTYEQKDVTYINNELSIEGLEDTSFVDSVVNKYAAFFGVNSVNVKHNIYEENSIYVSNPIVLSSSLNPISIKADYDEGEYGSIEFYIYDGIKKINILPLETKNITNEKCFYGIDLRFDGDNYSYSRNLDVDQNILSIDDIDFSDGGTYTVTYTPNNDESYYSYSPTNKTIRIAAILRVYKVKDNSTSEKKPPYIKSIHVIENKKV